MSWITTLDIIGVFVFALSGGMDAVKYKLDLLGVFVLAVATGVGGGIMRDVLLGDTPPAVFTNQIYLMACLFAGLIVIFFSKQVQNHFEWIKIADAVGLGIFAALGASKAIDYGLGWVGVIMIATMSAAGGGLIRDLLVREIPMILRADFYATAAILGGVVMLLIQPLTISTEFQIVCAAAVSICARIIAIKFGLSLPKIRS